MVRQSNFSNIQLQQAAVIISSTQYDKRALTCTDPLSLTNSLANLSYMTSVSPMKIAYILSADGGLEILVKILHDVGGKVDHLSCTSYTAALTCLSNISVRGNQKLRKRLVDAGVVPVILELLVKVVRVLEYLSTSVSNRVSMPGSHDGQNSLTIPPRIRIPLNTRINSRDGGEINVTESEEISVTPIARAAEDGFNNAVSEVDMEAATSLTMLGLDEERTRSTQGYLSPQRQQQYGPSESFTNTSEPLPNNDPQQPFLARASSSSSSRSSQGDGNDLSSSSSSLTPLSQQLSNDSSESLLLTQYPSQNFEPRGIYNQPTEQISSLQPPIHTSTSESINNITNTIPPQQALDRTSMQRSSSEDELISDVLFRTDDILLAIKLIAYLSKYPSIRADLHTGFGRNVFELIEVFTSPSNLVEIRRWAIICMRNAFKRDSAAQNSTEGGDEHEACEEDEEVRREGVKSLRKCGNLKCGKWEEKPRQYSKCSRCRRVAYCSKACQRTSWPLHKNWCLKYEGSSNLPLSNESHSHVYAHPHPLQQEIANHQTLNHLVPTQINGINGVNGIGNEVMDIDTTPSQTERDLGAELTNALRETTGNIAVWRTGDVDMD